jgi:UDP-N-acetylmuramate-alanine ligase
MIHIQQNDPCIIHATPGSADWLLVGICGAGMRAFAEMLIDAGQNVTGTDLDSAALAQLGTSMPGASMKRPLGSTFRLRPWDAAPDFGTARPVNVVHSVAVPESCSHLVHAKQLGFPVLSLPVAMGAAMENLRQVCIAGTHGKTTSSGMVWWILNQCGQAPAGFIGGEFCSSVGEFWGGKDCRSRELRVSQFLSAASSSDSTADGNRMRSLRLFQNQRRCGPLVPAVC